MARLSRNYYWEPKSGSLVLLSDGGAFLRTGPSKKGGGKWTSLAGDTAAMEFVEAKFAKGRWVGGAQDNTVQLSNGSATDPAIGYIFGDGTVVDIDAVSGAAPRYWGCTQVTRRHCHSSSIATTTTTPPPPPQNLGNFVDSDMPGPHRRLRSQRRRLFRGDDDDDGDDDEHFGFGFWEEPHGFVGVPLMDWFEVYQFQFFYQPFALSATDPTRVYLAATAAHNASAPRKTSGIYALTVPRGTTMQNNTALAPPTLEVATGDVYVLVAGGVTAGAADGSVLVGMNATHLLHRSAASGGALRERRLPMTFASPVVFKYDAKGDYILGPTSHDRTVSLAVSPADSSLVAVTGWASVLDNEGDERVFLSTDAGATWNDVTANLAAATATVGKVRPSALVLVPTGNGRETALVVGAANGAYATVVQGADGAPRDGKWQRLGPCSALPLVMVAGLSYDGESDTIAAATMGRGVYLMKEASKALGAL